MAFVAAGFISYFVWDTPLNPMLIILTAGATICTLCVCILPVETLGKKMATGSVCTTSVYNASDNHSKNYGSARSAKGSISAFDL